MVARRDVLLLALSAVLVGLMAASLPSSAAASAQGFLDARLPTPVANPLSSPTAIVPIPGTGRALILEKGGAVRVLTDDGTLLADDALNLSVCTSSEQGLLGAAVDPGFATNGFVYLFYSRNAGNCASSAGRFNRVSRFTMTGDTISPASEVVLLDNMNIPAGNHDGGDLDIGNDGQLYVTVGDGGINPRGPGPSAAQDLSLLNGKILRITTAGGVPPDNPFVGAANARSCAASGLTTATSDVCTEIYGYGLRNPFRFAFDPNSLTTRFFINDVGQSTWEEVDDGGPGRNYGWDGREGFCNVGSSTICPPTPGGLTDPLTTYNHNTGCTYVTAAAFIPNGTWAPKYDGGYLFADGGCGKMFLLAGAGTVDYGDPVAQTSGVISDMAFITQQGTTSLYYVTNASAQIHRITYDDVPPPRPVLQGSVPASPSSTLKPRIRGTAEADSLVRLYTASDCSGPVAGSNHAIWFSYLGTEVSVAANSTTTFYGTATDAAGNTSPCSTTSVTYAAPRHVVWVMMENKSYSQVVGSVSAPYLNGLIGRFGLAASFYGETHPSLGNYIAATSGSTQDIVDDNAPASHPLNVPNLFGQVAHRTYAESMPAACFKTNSGLYTPRHNPETYYTNLPNCTSDNLPLPDAPRFEQPFTLVVPNLCSDMHACPSTTTVDQQVAAGDAFLTGFVPKVLASPEYQAGTLTLFIAFDEDDYASSQHTLGVVVSPRTAAGTVSTTRVDHYSLLRTTEELLGLPLLGAAVSAPSMRGDFGL